MSAFQSVACRGRLSVKMLRSECECLVLFVFNFICVINVETGKDLICVTFVSNMFHGKQMRTTATIESGIVLWSYLS